MKTRISIDEHSKERMETRNVTIEEIEDCLEYPGQIISSRDNRAIYQKLLPLNGKRHLLRLIVEKKGDVFDIITVYKTSKINKYWKEEDFS